MRWQGPDTHINNSAASEGQKFNTTHKLAVPDSPNPFRPIDSTRLRLLVVFSHTKQHQGTLHLHVEVCHLFTSRSHGPERLIAALMPALSHRPLTHRPPYSSSNLSLVNKQQFQLTQTWQRDAWGAMDSLFWALTGKLSCSDFAKTFERKIKFTLGALVSFNVARDQELCDVRFPFRPRKSRNGIINSIQCLENFHFVAGKSKSFSLLWKSLLYRQFDFLLLWITQKTKIASEVHL